MRKIINKILKFILRDKTDGLIKVFNDTIRYTIKAETTSTPGKINLIGGIIVVILALSCFFKNIFVVIIRLFNPNYNDGMPSWFFLVAFLGVIFYFLYCMKYNYIIEKNRDNSKNK